MRKIAFPYLFGLFCLSLSAWPAWAEPLQVFVSVLPQAYLVERVGGGHIAVSVMVEPGKSPEVYEPGARQLAQLASASVYFRIGMPFEEVWLARVAQSYPRLRMVDQRAVVDQPIQLEHGHGEHAHGDVDPHIWTSPVLMQKLAEQIRDELSAEDPAHGEDYAANCQALTAELSALHDELQAMLKASAGKRFLVFHPAWGYFAQAYGLIQVAIEADGKEPSGKRLAALIEQARADRIQVIFVQPQTDRRHAETIAQAIGAQVIGVNPLAHRDYADNLRRLASAISAR
jgi:zinc transport system substrate-binding protein